MKRLAVPILVLFAAASAFAQEEQKVATRTRIAKQSTTSTGDRGLFTVPSVETLNRNQFSFGAAWSNVDRTPGDLDVSSIPVFFSYGVLGPLTVTGAFETHRQITARNRSQLGFNTSFPFVNDDFVSGIGDTIISAKYRIQRRSDNVGGIAIKGFVKLPTARKDDDINLGTGATDVGLDLVFSSVLPLGFILHSNVALTSTSDATEPFARSLKDQLRTGFGTAWPSSGFSLFGGVLQGIVEYATLSYIGAGSANQADVSVQNPSDITGGVRYLMLDRGLTFDAGYRNNRNFDFDFPNNRNEHGFTVSVSYTRPVIVPDMSNRYPVLALEADSTEIAAGSSTSITATGFDGDNDPLTYSWTSTGGRITGSGEKIIFDATGLPPGKYTVRATASDGRGGVSTSQIDITVLPLE